MLENLTDVADAVKVFDEMISITGEANAVVVAQLMPTLAELFAIKYVEFDPTGSSAVAVPVWTIIDPFDEILGDLCVRFSIDIMAS